MYELFFERLDFLMGIDLINLFQSYKNSIHTYPCMMGCGCLSYTIFGTTELASCCLCVM